MGMYDGGTDGAGWKEGQTKVRHAGDRVYFDPGSEGQWDYKAILSCHVINDRVVYGQALFPGPADVMGNGHAVSNTSMT